MKPVKYSPKAFRKPLFLRANQIQVGSQWSAADGSRHSVTVYKVEGDQVFYRWGDGKTHNKDSWSFQVRYGYIGG